ncbi:hypothetical protein FHX42_000925 [Saccharopolyspora lacisalsi]|uniref:Uncharacterized protein n=1 Tax=Halosaccharopolyspora lacisalsi TaxID=1000566 RepID=A0A839DTI9_9PSEU|nr:DUF5685 family protein [Halosaccharopolyspora lacisalsi]MBA8823596.1 hypothetical protein [Halosaccharopolyspora lacisalsi]
MSAPAVRTPAHRLVAHLCGLFLALRSEHGEAARTATNYDGLVISVLVEAQSGEVAPRRRAGPCPLRGMRRASVVRGEGARLAAAVSLVLASVKLRDHADDGDGALRHAALAEPARRTAARWGERGGTSGAHVGFDAALLTEAAGRQQGVEESLSPGDSVLVATEPTGLATSAAPGHTAVLAERPANAEPLAEVGRLFGRAAHLLDAAEDLAADAANGSWNPLVATATDPDGARRLCDDAVHGVRLALREVEFTDSKLVHALLVHELEQAVRRAFGHAVASKDGQDAAEAVPSGRRGRWVLVAEVPRPVAEASCRRGLPARPLHVLQLPVLLPGPVSRAAQRRAARSVVLGLL